MYPTVFIPLPVVPRTLVTRLLETATSKLALTLQCLTVETSSALPRVGPTSSLVTVRSTLYFSTAAAIFLSVRHVYFKKEISFSASDLTYTDYLIYQTLNIRFNSITNEKKTFNFSLPDRWIFYKFFIGL